MFKLAVPASRAFRPIQSLNRSGGGAIWLIVAGGRPGGSAVECRGVVVPFMKPAAPLVGGGRRGMARFIAPSAYFLPDCQGRRRATLCNRRLGGLGRREKLRNSLHSPREAISTNVQCAASAGSKYRLEFIGSGPSGYFGICFQQSEVLGPPHVFSVHRIAKRRPGWID